MEYLGDSDNGSFLAAMFNKSVKFLFVVRGFIKSHGCMDTLHQSRFEVDINTCDLNRYLLTTRFIIDSFKINPGHKRFEVQN